MGSSHAGMRRSKTNLASLSHHSQQHARQRSFDHKPKRSQLSHSNLKQLSGGGSGGARSPEPASHSGLMHSSSRKKGSSSALSRKGKMSATNLHRLPSEYEDEDVDARDPKADSSWVSESEASTPGDSGPPSPKMPVQQPPQAGQDLSSTPKASQPPSPVKQTSTPQQQQQQQPADQQAQENKEKESPTKADASSSTASTSTHARSPSLARRRNRSTASLRSTSSVLSSKLMPLRTLAPAPLQPQVDKSFEAPSVISSPAPPGLNSDQQQQKSASGLGLTSASNEPSSSATLIHHHPERQQSTSSQSDAHQHDTQSDLTRRLEAMAGHSNGHAHAAAAAVPPSPHLSSQQPQHQQQQPLKRSSPSASQVLTSGAWDMPRNNQQRGSAAQQQNIRKRQSPLISKFISPSNQPRQFPLRSSWSGTMDTLTESPDQPESQQQRVQRSSSGNKPVSRTQQRLMMEKNAPPVMSAQNEPHYHPGSEVPCTTAHSQLIPPHAHQHHHTHHQSSPVPPPSPGSDDRPQQQQQQHQLRLHHQQQQQQQLQQQHQMQHEQMILDNEEQDHESQLNEPAHRARQVHSLKMWALAVVREAEKVDKEHDFVRRFHDPITESLSRCAQIFVCLK